MKSLLILSICITSTFAKDYSILNYVKASTIDNKDCGPLFYGPNCEIPYCFPQSGYLSNNHRENKYHCVCHDHRYVGGAHCEIINCHDGNLSNSTFQCECPYYTFGDFCQVTPITLLVLFLMCLFMLMMLWIYLVFKRFLKVIRQNPETGEYIKALKSICCNIELLCQVEESRSTTNNSQNVTPEVRVVERVVERVVYRDIRDDPPTYETATDGVHPPTYDAVMREP
uniref:EGF-like domain-containing protein n=1 Tax=Panagrellus redivivus TaxID=6233 RepID=A0A7E4VD20_PANRE